MARNGFKVSKSLEIHLKEIESEIKADEVMQEIFIINGSLATENTVIKNIRLANALEELVYNERAFYEGKIGDNFVNAVDHNIKKNDLTNYAAISEESLLTYNYNGLYFLTYYN